MADGSIARWGLASTLTIHYIQPLLYTDGSEMRCCSRGMSAAQSPFLKKREIMVIIHLTQSVFQITTHRQHFTYIYTRLTMSEFIKALPIYKDSKLSQLSNWLMFHLKLGWLELVWVPSLQHPFIFAPPASNLDKQSLFKDGAMQFFAAATLCYQRKFCW